MSGGTMDGTPAGASPAAWLLRALVRVYQWTLAPVLGNNCRFEPSCSNYALEALSKHGAIRGGLLAAWPSYGAIRGAGLAGTRYPVPAMLRTIIFITDATTAGTDQDP
jgi:hypothetical protein